MELKILLTSMVATLFLTFLCKFLESLDVEDFIKGFVVIAWIASVLTAFSSAIYYIWAVI